VFVLRFSHATVRHGAEVIPACSNHAETCCNHSSRTDFAVVAKLIAMFTAKVSGKFGRIQNRIQFQDLKMLCPPR
jgi:hypothetical protein